MCRKLSSYFPNMLHNCIAVLFEDATESKSTARRQLDPLLDGMTEAELKIVIATAQAILDARAEGKNDVVSATE